MHGKGGNCPGGKKSKKKLNYARRKV